MLTEDTNQPMFCAIQILLYLRSAGPGTFPIVAISDAFRVADQKLAMRDHSIDNVTSFSKLTKLN